uniref:Uncharacterized protein n=1 Tax=Panagrolaimus sp. ES5 TaxID=591445 RepID=A0AC34GFH7_9BILA
MAARGAQKKHHHLQGAEAAQAYRELPIKEKCEIWKERVKEAKDTEDIKYDKRSKLDELNFDLEDYYGKQFEREDKAQKPWIKVFKDFENDFKAAELMKEKPREITPGILTKEFANRDFGGDYGILDNHGLTNNKKEKIFLTHS